MDKQSPYSNHETRPFSSESLREAIEELNKAPEKYSSMDTTIVEELAIGQFVAMFGKEALELLNFKDTQK